MQWYLIFGLFFTLAQAHDEYYGQCPVFTPMSEFNWQKFKDGVWYATEKFDTQSKCLTYEFFEEDTDEYVVEQTSVLTGLKRFSVDNKVKYRGKLSAPYVSEPANMIVRFPLSLLGTASFVILDTDYATYALVCTCQARKFIFDVLTFHRRSCTILQRSPEHDSTIARKLHDLLNEQIPTDDGDEKADHDFDIISHVGCDYKDNDKGLQLDVDKIIGNTERKVFPYANPEQNSPEYEEYGDWITNNEFDKELIGDTVRGAAETVLGALDDSVEEADVELLNMPVKDEKPKL